LDAALDEFEAPALVPALEGAVALERTLEPDAVREEKADEMEAATLDDWEAMLADWEATFEEMEDATLLTLCEAEEAPEATDEATDEVALEAALDALATADERDEEIDAKVDEAAVARDDEDE